MHHQRTSAKTNTSLARHCIQQEVYASAKTVPITTLCSSENYINYSRCTPSRCQAMQPASEEQKVVIRLMKEGYNVVVDAVAGSGKSTTILSLAREMPEKRILQIAYNAMLRKDVESKLKQLGIMNVTVHTFHSLGVSFYLDTAHTDTGLRKIVLENRLPKREIPSYDIIVPDESQDMSFLYFQFLVKFACDMGTQFQLCVLGDYMQGLYEFKGADIRALTMADQIWETHPFLQTQVFHKCTLKTSYRITSPMSFFVNEVLLGQERLAACKAGEPVVYIRNSRRNLEIVVITQILALLADGESPGDIFVLGASVKGVNSHIRKMENALVERGIPCYVPTFDTEGMDERITKNKVVFSTFHSVKGRERKYVFVMGFDQSYFSIYAQNLPTDKCPNTLYVACTRATKRLFLLEIDEYSTDRPLEFLKRTHHEMRDSSYVSFKGIPRTIFYERTEDNAAVQQPQKERFRDITPTDLVKFVPEHVIEDLSPLLDTVFIQECEPDKSFELSIPTMIETSNGMYEDVCDLNGIAIPSIYYDHLYRTFSVGENVGANILKQIITETMRDTRDGDYVYLKSMLRDMPEECRSASDYLYLSNLFVAVKEKLLFKMKQIERGDYGWLAEDTIEQCMRRLDAVIGGDLTQQQQHPNTAEPPLIEYPIIQYDMDNAIERLNQVLAPHFPNMEKKFRFSARLDLVTRRCIWELKCTSSITVEHKLQVALYAWLWNIVYSANAPTSKHVCSNPRETRIFNIRTGEKWFLNASFHELTTIVVALLKGKYDKPAVKPDDEFVADCRRFIATQRQVPRPNIL